VRGGGGGRRSPDSGSSIGRGEKPACVRRRSHGNVPSQFQHVSFNYDFPESTPVQIPRLCVASLVRVTGLLPGWRLDSVFGVCEASLEPAIFGMNHEKDEVVRAVRAQRCSVDGSSGATQRKLQTLSSVCAPFPSAPSIFPIASTTTTRQLREQRNRRSTGEELCVPRGPRVRQVY
jgi:hypothetical protein